MSHTKSHKTGLRNLHRTALGPEFGTGWFLAGILQVPFSKTVQQIGPLYFYSLKQQIAEGWLKA
jgi:hypothetical protein